MDAVAGGANQSELLEARLLDAVPDAIVVLDAGLGMRYANEAARAFFATGGDEDGSPFDATALLHPDDVQRVVEELAPVLAEPGTSRAVRARIVNPTETRPIEVVVVNLLDDPAVRGLVASFKDLRGERAAQLESERYLRLLEHNEELRGELHERQAFQERLLQIQQSISRRMPLDDVLVAVVHGARELLGDEIAELRLDRDHRSDDAIVVRSHDGACRVLRDAEAAGAPRLADVVRRATVAAGPGVEPADHAAASEWLCGITVPIKDRDRSIGHLTVATARPGRTYRPVEQEMIVNLAEHASVALLDARTVESAQAAFSDPLTGLPNRALLMDRLAQSVERCARRGTPLAVLFIDLARFKGINDSYGHAVGDAVLHEVGRRLGAAIRLPDTAARLGGDEFVVVLEDTEAEVARAVAERLIAAIRVPIRVADRVLFADATVGITVARDGEQSEQCEVLLRHADIAMYCAKTSSRDHAFFEPAMQSELVARQELESDLRGAIADLALGAALQPLVDLTTGTIVGVEALARWHHPTRGNVPADEFIAAAERIGTIIELDRLVWAAACGQVGGLPRHGSAPALAVSLNLSVRHLLAGDIVPALASIIAGSGLTPDRVSVEITETELMKDVVLSVERLHELRELGVHLVIDDFGTGYSSLAYLQTLPVESIKIDRSFVRGVDRSGRGRQLVQAMVNLAHDLDLSVVAEGVETEAEAATVRDMGADLGQGFWFARPLSIVDLGRAVYGRDPDADRC